ncbi:sigma 54-interacting transcriptional regulator [Micromonospora cathayae]|uniref:Sigma 54-interacting transcriptional regulator n=1 Tax=Micromonospora cathayae TaxID=3028804 RepID=A0ABY7ZJ48_9ACTN|nr:sigma 54-interacting transcriptional regulator [Micromonospora sp. HUAS 3]WDZ82903.1 sigma 54-interacting transcriptional regulator [Micromonospora sp. HUAS 3]
MTGGYPDDPWALLAAGATEVLASADGLDVLPGVAARIRRWHQVDRIVQSLPAAGGLVGESPALRRALRTLVEIARFSDAPVLIQGESGTGKELAARLVHTLDPKRRSGPLVVVDCTTIVANLSAPQLFGHERGAFTGAHSARSGAFADAHRGVLFLDEVGELPESLQPELLRVLQERTFRPLGSSTWQKTDFRLVCATNRNLEELEKAGRFRRDLRSRLSAVTVDMPPLSDRRDDIPALARHFLGQVLQTKPPVIETAVERILTVRPYPGNVRELRHLLAQIAVGYVGDGRITVGMVPEAERPGAVARKGTTERTLRAAVREALDDGLDLRGLKSAVAEIAVEIALADCGGQLGRAAERLGVTTRALQLRKAMPAPGAG